MQASSQQVYEHRTREQRAMFARRAQLASLMLLGCVSLAFGADKVIEPSDEFLEYLGSMEGSDDNWTDFADSSAHEITHEAEKSVVSASSSSAASGTKAASATGKADK